MPPAIAAQRTLAQALRGVGVSVVLVDSDDETRRLLTSLQLRFHCLRTGSRGPPPRPVARIEDLLLLPSELAGVNEM